MPLEAGSKLGRYEILAPLGAGGMGEVYRARDPRLSREVAIKVLPAVRKADEGRRRRFAQEARAASALNHPGIVTVHEIDSVDGVDFIVMEHVAGKTIDRLIPRRGMPVGEVLRIAISLADALARAHGAGIVHRDLKPSNVAVKPDGAVKILDFGLAKLVGSDESGDAVVPTAVTETAEYASRPGTVAGTPGYMSPEQAAGRPVDARSDVFALGALLYEMLTGRPAFSGASGAELRAAVLTAQPRAPRELVPALPPALDRLVQRCLRKEPERRYQHVLDLKVDVQEIQEEAAAAAASTSHGGSRGRSARGPGWRGMAAVVAGICGLGALVAIGWFLNERPAPQAPPHVEPLTALRGVESWPTFSPDGRQVAFAWSGESRENGDIYVKMLGASELHRLSTDPAWETAPRWSPDGRQIAFVRSSPEASTIHLVSPLGGPARRMSDLPVVGPPSWSADSKWLVAARQCPSEPADGDCGLWRVPAESGEPRPVLAPPQGGQDLAPALSPEGRRLAYASCASRNFPPPCDVHLVDLDSSLDPVGPSRRLTRNNQAIHDVAWTPDGRSIVYTVEPGPYTLYLWRVDAEGRRPAERVEIAGFGAREAALAGDRLAFSRMSFDHAVARFSAAGPPEVVLDSSFFDAGPSFSPDGRRLAFESMRSGERLEIWLADADGRNPVQLTRGPGAWQGSPSWSPDGRRIAFDSRGADGHWDIWSIDAEGGSPRRLTRHPGDENVPTWSLDGRWIYFGAEREGTPGVFRIPAEGGDEARLTRAPVFGGARESADGRVIYFKRGWGRSPIVAHSLVDGSDRAVVDCVAGMPGFALAGDRLYYAACGKGDPLLTRLDLRSGGNEALGPLPGGYGTLAVSPDELVLLFVRYGAPTADLALVESFR